MGNFRLIILLLMIAIMASGCRLFPKESPQYNFDESKFYEDFIFEIFGEDLNSNLRGEIFIVDSLYKPWQLDSTSFEHYSFLSPPCLNEFIKINSTRSEIAYNAPRTYLRTSKRSKFKFISQKTNFKKLNNGNYKVMFFSRPEALCDGYYIMEVGYVSPDIGIGVNYIFKIHGYGKIEIFSHVETSIG